MRIDVSALLLCEPIQAELGIFFGRQHISADSMQTMMFPLLLLSLLTAAALANPAVNGVLSENSTICLSGVFFA